MSLVFQHAFYMADVGKDIKKGCSEEERSGSGYNQWNYWIPNWVVCWHYVAIDAPVTELLFNATY